MFISIVIPVFNREAYIYKAVSSVLEQTYKNWELIVVDDHSTDDTYFSIFYLLNDKRISYYYLSKNSGVSFARNYGIKKARGEYIAFLDSDDYWLPEKLEKQIAFLKEKKAKISQTDEFWYRKNRFVNPKLKHKKISGNIFEKSLEMCIVSPSAVIIHHKVFDEVGLFDEQMPACEDYDLWLRISLKYDVELLEEKLIVKRGGHDDQLSKLPGLDRYRIYSLLKILKTNELSKELKRKVIDTLKRKIRIYLNGCKKRNKLKEAIYYNHLLNKITKLQ